MKDSHCTETWKYFSQSATTVLAWLYREGQINFLALSGGGTDDENVMSTQELKKDKYHLPHPLSSSDYKNVNHWVPGQRQCLLARLWTLQASYSNNSLLIYHSASCWILFHNET